jgi:hypothetical protein
MTRPVLWPTQPPIQLVSGTLSLAVKRQRREADHLLSSSAVIKSGTVIPSLSSCFHGVVLNYIIKCRDNSRRSWISIPERGRDHTFLLSVHIGSGTQPTTYPICTWGSFPGGKSAGDHSTLFRSRMVDLYHHFSIHVRGVVLKELNTRITSHLPATFSWLRRRVYKKFERK